MTYGATLQRTAERRAQKPIPFVLPTTADWFETPKSLLRGVVVEPIWQASPSFKPASASSITLPAYQFSLVEQLYILRRRNEVTGFLKAHPFLVPLILEAYGKIAEYFGPSAEVVLEVTTDPEAEDDQELFVLMQAQRSPHEALACLDRLDQEWWLDALPKAQCKMTIDVEYR